MRALGVVAGVFALVATIFASGLGASPRAPVTTLAPGTYSGIAEGGVDRYNYKGNGETGDNLVYSNSQDSYRARLEFTLTVAADGEVEGSGTGVYTLLTWHLEGRNGQEGRSRATSPPRAIRSRSSCSDPPTPARSCG